jgi:hypothetical protein
VASSDFNRPRSTSARLGKPLRCSFLLSGLLGLTTLAACAIHPRPQVVTVRTLESAVTVLPHAARRAVLSPASELRGLYCPLSERLGLLQIRTKKDWQTLRRHAPEIGPCPDLSHGIVVGLTSHAGLPLDGSWPIRLETARVHQGAGFVTAHFQGGSFLPDGTTYLETAQFNGLRIVLMAEVNGVRFYPE